MKRVALDARLLLPALAAGFIQVVGSFGAADRQPGARPLDALAVVLLLLGPAALPARRRYPVGTLVAAVAALLGYLAMGYPYGPVVLSVVVALVNAVVHRRRRAAWLVTVPTYLAMVVLFWFREGRLEPLAVSGLAAWLLVLLTLGELLRGRRERQARERLARAEEARARATEERLRIARDLHDVLAHHVSLINVQAGTALHLLDEQPGLAREALTAIKASSKEVLVELRGMLGVLRRVDEELPLAPTAGLAGLDALAQRMRGTGLPVTVRTEGAARALPTALDTAAFRIAQEALTNVHRHAGADSASVLLDYSGPELVLQVDDDGRGTSGDPAAGNGIPGMRERAAAFGGRLDAGPRPGGGFRVRAQLPIPGEGGSS